MLRFCILSIWNLKIRYASTTTNALLLRFCCALAVSATIRVVLTNISNRSGIAVQWNGGFIEVNLSACMWAATRENLSSGYRKSKIKSQYLSTKGVISGLTDKKGQIKSISLPHWTKVRTYTLTCIKPNLFHQDHTGKFKRRFGGIYAYCRCFIDRKR